MKITELPVLIWVRIKKSVGYAIIFMIIWRAVTSLVLSHFQAEAEIALNSISACQHGHYQGHGYFTEDFADLDLGFDIYSRYSLFIGPDEYDGRPLDELGLSLPVDFAALGAPEPGLTEDGFVAVAVGNIDFDEDLDVWVVDQDNFPQNVQSDVFSFYRFFRDALSGVEGGDISNGWLALVSLIFVAGVFCAWVWVRAGG